MEPKIVLRFTDRPLTHLLTTSVNTHLDSEGRDRGDDHGAREVGVEKGHSEFVDVDRQGTSFVDGEVPGTKTSCGVGVGYGLLIRSLLDLNLPDRISPP